MGRQSRPDLPECRGEFGQRGPVPRAVALVQARLQGFGREPDPGHAQGTRQAADGVDEGPGPGQVAPVQGEAGRGLRPGRFALEAVEGLFQQVGIAEPAQDFGDVQEVGEGLEPGRGRGSIC